MAQCQREGGLVERLVEAGEGLPGVGGAELGHCQVAAARPVGGVGEVEGTGEISLFLVFFFFSSDK